MLPDIFTIDGRWLDTEDWEFDVTVMGDDGQPLNLTGSTLRLTFRALADGAIVSQHDTAPGVGLTVKNALGGVLTVTSPVALWTWRCPLGVAGYVFPQTIIGDVMRQANSGGAYRAVQRFALVVLPGTTIKAA